MATTAPMDVAIVSEGCRGDRLCRVVAGLRQVGRIHLVSRRNARGVHDWLAQEGLAGRVTLHGKLDPVLWNAGIAAAIVAGPPAEHFATARWLLENGKHVLVESPFVATRREAQTLIGMGEARGLAVAAGYERLFASYVHYFRSVVHNDGHPHPIAHTRVVWHDMREEARPGWAMPRETGARVIAELLPEALTLLTVVLGRHPAAISAVTTSGYDAGAVLELSYGPHPVEISLSRAARAPRRAVEIVTCGGRRFGLDFTREPGSVARNGCELPPDPLWTTMPRPQPAAVASFLDHACGGRGTPPLLARDLLHIVDGTEQAVRMAGEGRGESPPREVRGNPPRIPAAAAADGPRDRFPKS